MPGPESLPIDQIYVPLKKRKTLRPEVVQEIAASILEVGQQLPILVRPDEGRLVLLEGLHRLEACKALGETTIIGVLGSAETAHHKALLSDTAETEAERDKMARLKKLRLEKEAADRSTASAAATMKPQSTELRSTRSGRNIGRGPSRDAGSKTKTLSEWLTQQKRDGGRY
ncbi:chromosome partitioning protein ParB [Bradyrhizobium sp. UFLA03-84]|uniref:ParB N-terminal domain-containing protein n=1 Tax=Bradyrhizobium sp. UFLA03-84 TaxID=418599 RepID=UPI000BAE2CBA|nr:ParB N-terminal domain-containing protein [Bradyrhizobium sp. UFLA03-84]PAY06145.1 chromosome partitioning protein ParB [Bradyrhizobium sp. UFLA03-84]